MAKLLNRFRSLPRTTIRELKPEYRVVGLHRNAHRLAGLMAATQEVSLRSLVQRYIEEGLEQDIADLRKEQRERFRKRWRDNCLTANMPEMADYVEDKKASPSQL